MLKHRMCLCGPDGMFTRVDGLSDILDGFLVDDVNGAGKLSGKGLRDMGIDGGKDGLKGSGGA